MVRISTGMEEPNTERMISAKISSGIDSIDVDDARQRSCRSPGRRRPRAKPSDGADREGQDRGGERHADRHPRAVDQAREHVAADIVGAEPERPRERRVPGAADGFGLAIGREPGREDGDEQIDRDDDDADPARRSVACGRRSSSLASLSSACRRRGLTRMARMSAIVLRMMKAPAKIRPQAWTTGTSRLETRVHHNWPTPG